MSATIATLYSILKDAPSNLVLSIELGAGEMMDVAVKEIRLSQVTIFSHEKDNIKINRCVLVLEPKK